MQIVKRVNDRLIYLGEMVVFFTKLPGLLSPSLNLGDLIISLSIAVKSHR